MAMKIFSRYFNNIYTGNRWNFFPGLMGKKEKSYTFLFTPTSKRSDTFLYKLSTVIHIHFTLPVLFD